MKREKFALYVLLAEIVVISALHAAKNNKPQAEAPTAQQQQAQPQSKQWNNFTLIRLK